MTPENILNTAEALKKEIEQNPARGASSLIEFANAHARENKLKHDALILKLNYSRAAGEKTQEGQLIQQMIELVDNVLLDIRYHAEISDDDALVREEERFQKLERILEDRQTPAEVVFRCTNLGKTYASGGFSLEDINMELKRGEITSVVGENGNGKTTLFRAVVGELGHDRGTLTYPAFKGGEKANKINWRRVKQNIAYVPQDLPSWDGSLRQILQFEAAIHGIKGKDNIRETNYIVQRLGLEDHLEKNWSQLSGGFKLRFSLARALIWKPKLLVIDEPLANLDIKTQLIILKDLRKLANSFRYPIAILLSSQHLHEIESVSDRILFLKNGQVEFYGELDALGVARQFNTFELNCDLTLQELKSSLLDLPHEKIYYNGISFVILTPLEVDYKQLLRWLMDREIAFDYFRDISQSVKQLFEL